RWALLSLIRVYWFLSPAFFAKRSCIFRLSCSNFVYQSTIQYGSVAGFRALVWRYRSCRPGYTVASDSRGDLKVRLVTGRVVPGSEIVESILDPYVAELRSAYMSINRNGIGP
ncbi:MAG: membrane protein insertion efficiency factor YidD, partial [Chloroflexi bacterium]|nr:membrane protein insertion efficiency factor YidD [Chloroflexota bacterium]